MLYLLVISSLFIYINADPTNELFSMLSNVTLMSHLESHDCFLQPDLKKTPDGYILCNKVEYLHRVVGMRQKVASKSFAKKKLEVISTTSLQDNYQTLFESYIMNKRCVL